MDILDKLYIINETDRPCMHLICREIGNKMIYVSEHFRRRYPNLQKSESTSSLIDFGFTYDNGVYSLKNKSIVKYSNGKPRVWQGKTSFTYKDIVDSKQWSD